jgi:hypothetical protein
MKWNSRKGEIMKHLIAAVLVLLVGFGISVAQIRPPAQSGVLTAFSSGTAPGQNNVQFSPDGSNLAGGSTVYAGCSPAQVMIPFAGGVLTAFQNIGCNTNTWRIHFSPDGNNLGSGSIRYEGCSPVKAMIPYSGGVLTAFDNVECLPHLSRIHFSPDGNGLGSGSIHYEGCSPVTAMIPFAGGVLTAFTDVECTSAQPSTSLNRVHFSPDGNNLGSGSIRYEGTMPVTAMMPFGGGVLIAFTGVPDSAGNPTLNRVQFSPDGNNLDQGSIVYEGQARVTAMIPFTSGVLTVFTNVPANQGNPNRVQFSADGTNLESGPIIYDGTTPVTAIIPFAFAPSDTFSGSTINSTRWEISSPLGSSTVTQNNGLFLTSDGTGASFPDTPGLFGPGAGVDSKCMLKGDFDIQVDFNALSAPGPNFTMAFFNVYQDANNQLHIKRISGTSANGVQTVYSSNGALTSLAVNAFSGTSGRFRITRKSSVLTTFFDPGSGFVQQFPGASLFSGNVLVSLTLLGPSRTSSSVTFQNFRVNSVGDVSCQ